MTEAQKVPPELKEFLDLVPSMMSSRADIVKWGRPQGNDIHLIAILPFRICYLYKTRCLRAVQALRKRVCLSNMIDSSGSAKPIMVTVINSMPSSL
ncbi:hypothetical protein SAMN05216332_103118 [Nitrosospira briensis]|nr:hypothetical protein SAMN05216332_103118 [Nitrosospira briensis]